MARRFVRSTLDHAPQRIVDVVILLTSELVTNALTHAHSAITLVLRTNGGTFRVEVTDESSRTPLRRAAPPDATSGRGLALVDAMAESWGVNSIANNGKMVWFEVTA